MIYQRHVSKQASKLMKSRGRDDAAVALFFPAYAKCIIAPPRTRDGVQIR